MARYIDADLLKEQMYHEAFEKTTDLQRWDSGCWIRYKMFENVIKSIPTADVVELEGSKVCKCLSYTTTGNPTADVRENVHAHWEIVYDEDCDSGGKYICGNCRHAFSFGAYFELCRFDYCPNCGAVMDERGNDE